MRGRRGQPVRGGLRLAAGSLGRGHLIGSQKVSSFVTSGSARGEHDTFPAVRGGVLNRYADLLRIALVPPCVVLCYSFEWSAWRSFVCGMFVAFSQAVGASVVQTSPTSFTYSGQAYTFVIACTALDVWFGSVPLLWEVGRGLRGNAWRLAQYSAGLFAANLVRLEIGFLLFERNVSWALAHEAMGGVFYFGCFLWIAHRRGWTQRLARGA